MNLLILVVDDEPDVEVLFRQQFRRDLRSGRSAECCRQARRRERAANVYARVALLTLDAFELQHDA
jgi:hypothetical protein